MNRQIDFGIEVDLELTHAIVTQPSGLDRLLDIRFVSLEIEETRTGVSVRSNSRGNEADRVADDVVRKVPGRGLDELFMVAQSKDSQTILRPMGAVQVPNLRRSKGPIDNPDQEELRERYREVLPDGARALLRFERFAQAVREE